MWISDTPISVNSRNGINSHGQLARRMADDDDDDVFGGAASSDDDVRTTPSVAVAETAAQRRTLQDAGYRDGASGPEGHALGLQKGFDEGFARGLEDGRALGKVLGVLNGIRTLEQRVPRGLPAPPLLDEDKRQREASIERLTALAPTMPAAADPAVASELAVAARLAAAVGVCPPMLAEDMVSGGASEGVK